ncbi:synaptonemal complex protein 2 isoform X2 [Diceros bicornis minor]|uniref:synaptonemal complex protein 2 isoform X2 n=1 Tax=Diceros bicornis minor TaxID=77932 RepID=UPI0026EA02C9|nr:synaptonemal complex protein 2 isoform X2 [Diceros bicornis minor]
MPIRPDLQQLEKCIDDALRKNDFRPLKTLLQIDICEDVKIKCSKQFFHKLDDLMCRELNKRDIQAVSIILVTLGRCGKNISVLGQAGLLAMIKQGLVQKMVAWFEKSKEIILSQGNSKDEAVINMIEDLFDLLMVIHDINDEGKRQVVESFVPRICALVIDSRVNICIQQETLKRMNAMLDKMPEDARKILCNQEMLILMSSMGERILDAGDYDLQVGIVEALCRMTTEKQRQELECQWFSMDFIANAFKGIKDSEFETDCRIFLNLVNGMLGDKRRVFTFPCLSAFLDKYELQIPSDEKLEEFWIDFNLGSRSLSFYIAGDNDDHQWEAVTVPEEKVQLYSIEATPRRGRVKPPLQMMSSAEKPGVSKTSENGADNAVSLKSRPSEGRNRGDNTDKHIKTAKVVEKTENKDIEFPNQNFNELQDIVPDSQAVGKVDKPVLPCVLDNIDGNKMHSKWSCWTPVTNIKLCNKLIASTSSEDTLNQDIIINKKLTKQKSSSSISGDNSEETEGVQYKKEIMQHNKIDKAEVEVYKRNNQRQLNHPKHLEQKNTENTEQSDWRIESETTFKSVLLNKTVEESLIYRKKYILSKDGETAICDQSPSPRNNVKSHRKSGKRLTSELNSRDLKQKKIRQKSKGKGFTDAAESLISEINKKYKPKDDIKSTRKLKESLIDGGLSNKSDLQLSKGKVQKKSYRQLKTTFVNVTSECPLNDVYNFNVNGADEPIIKLGIEEFQATTREACVDNSIKLVGLRNHDEFEPSLKTKDKRIVTNHKKKNLFSDTDTEYRCDDSKTDISWLRESKSKPQLIDYSRNKNVKKHKSGKSRPSLEREQPRSKMTPNKNITKKIKETVPVGRTRLPRRATKTKKNYKDLSNSESESEQEFSHSFKEKLLVKEENIRSRSKTMKLRKKQQNAFSSETQKDTSKEWKNSSLLKDTVRDNSHDLAPISLSGSPSSIEVMRCIEKITEKNFTQDDDCITKSISPYPKSSSPESLNSKYGAGGPIKSPKNSEKNLLYTRESCSPIPRSYFLESHSASPLSMSSEGREKIWCDMPSDSTHVSGPTQHLSRKRMHIEDNLSNSSDDVELEGETQERADLLPKKLSKTKDADHHAYKVSESVSPLSTNVFSIPGENWETEISGVGMMCEQLNTEFRRKIQIRYKMMDYFTKQSWKIAQQHLKTMNHQIQEYRIKKLDKFQFIIIEELENFEKDSQSLKDLEKEFVDFWEKLYQKFNAYQKSEQQRLHLLKASLDKNVFYHTDYEETIFTSEMCLMKENMKMLQDRLLKEMQEEELLNVRRGLMSLFMAHERNVNV